MTDKTKWEDYLGEPFPLPSLAQIKKVESQLNVSFPMDYIKCLLEHQGQVYGESCIKIGKYSVIVGCLFHVNEKKSEHDSYGIIYNRLLFVEQGYKTLVPFTDNTGGSMFCFNYSEINTEPTISFVNSDLEPSDEKSITHVANSFTDFMNKLEID